MAIRHIKHITVNAGQTVPDIAVQEYGNVEGVILVLLANPGLNITDDLVNGQDLIIWTDETVQTISELVKVEPYASQLQNLLMQWAALVNPGNTIVVPTPPVTTNGVFIPPVTLELGADQDNNQLIYASWQSGLLEFLDYNPKLWLFRWSRSKRWNAVGKESWEARKDSTKWRHPTKFYNNGDHDYPTVEWDCPIYASPEKAIVGFEPEKWAIDGGGPTCSHYRRSRKRLDLELTGNSEYTISTNFGVAICINNPANADKAEEDWVRPYKIWGQITRFRLETFVKTNQSAVPPTSSFKNAIKLLK